MQHATAPAPRAARRGPGTGLRAHGFGAPVVLLACLLTLAAQLSPLAFVLVLFHVSDGVLETRNMATLVALVLVYLILVLFSGLFQAMRASLLAAVAERFTLRLRAEAMQAAVRNAVRTEPAQGTGLLQDITTLQSFLRSPMPVSAFDAVGATVPLAMMFYLDRGLGLIALAGILLAVLLGILLHRTTASVAGEARRRLHETNADLGGQLVHPDLVRGLGMLWASLLRWQPRYDAALASMENAHRRGAAIAGIDDLVMTVYEMAVKGYACYLIFIELGTFGLLLAASIFCFQVVVPFGIMARSWESWAAAGRSWQRIRAALAEHAEPVPLPPDPTAAPGLVIEGARFHPPGREQAVIEDITLRLPPGTVLTVEGPNGAGKSTLLRLILGLMPPTAGRVMLDGQDTYRCDRATFGARVGYLPQDVQLIEGHVFHNIGRAPGASADLVVAAARAAGAHAMIGRLPRGYQSPAGMTSGLSAGQRRLIGLARALYGEPRLLILDEPEVGLDGQARMALRSAVGAMRARGGIIVIVTHEPDTWRGAADLRLVMGADGGWQVQPSGTHAEDDDGRIQLAGPR